MPRRHRRDLQPAPHPAQIDQVVPERVVTDLKARTLRVRIDDGTFIADGWGGEHAEVALCSITEVLVYDVALPTSGGPDPRWSGILLLNADEQVMLRVTGRWHTDEVCSLFSRHGFHACTRRDGTGLNDLLKVRRINRRKYRAPCLRKLNMRSRWLVPWRAAVFVGGLLGLWLLIDRGRAVLGEAAGSLVGLLLGAGLWFIVGARLPDWIRDYHQRRRTYLQTSHDDRHPQ